MFEARDTTKQGNILFDVQFYLEFYSVCQCDNRMRKLNWTKWNRNIQFLVLVVPIWNFFIHFFGYTKKRWCQISKRIFPNPTSKLRSWPLKLCFWMKTTILSIKLDPECQPNLKEKMLKNTLEFNSFGFFIVYPERNHSFFRKTAQSEWKTTIPNNGWF